MQFFKFTIILTADKENPETYNVSVPAFPEIVTYGGSLEEARFMAQDALELVILSRLEEGEKIPADKKLKKIPKNAKVEEVIVNVSHKVETSSADYVKNTLFKTTWSLRDFICRWF